MSQSTPAAIEAPYWDPYDPELNADPYPVFRRLREELPLYRNDKHDFFALSRYDDVEKGMSDHATFISGKGAMLEFIKADVEMPRGFFIFEDPPIHTAHRGVLARVFTPKKMNALEPKVREFTARCLDPLVGSDGFDLIEKLGAVMPISVIGMLLGIPETDTQKVRERIDNNLRAEHGKATDTDFIANIEAGFEEYIEWRINNPSDDLMTQVMTTEFTDETGTQRRLTREEVSSIVHVLAGAGNETTNRFLGWAGKLLAEHPDQRRQLVENPALIPQAVEEILRYHPPGPAAARYVTRDVEYYGQKVPAGSAMVFLLGAANRDESRYTDAEAFDINRERRPHLTFGHGIHTCIGAALTRLEGRVALEELLKRFPDWQVDLDTARLVASTSTRGFESLPIYFGDTPVRRNKPASTVSAEPAKPVTAESLAGEWTVTVKGPTGAMITTLALAYGADGLTGTQSGEGSHTEISDARLDGNTFYWKNAITKPIKVKTQFTGEVAGDTMSGEVKAGFMGKFPFTATRA